MDIPNLIEQFESAVIKEKVDIITFAEDPKFLGRQLFPRQRTILKIIFLQDLDDYDLKVIKEWEDPLGECELVPKLFERIEYLKSVGAPHFRTVQFVGGRRSSKGFLTGICIAYKVYLLTLHDDFHEEYNLPAGKEVYFNIVADSLDQAKAHQFSDAADAIMDVKPFQKSRLFGKSLAESISINTQADLRRLAALRSGGMKIDRDMGSIIVKANGTNSKTIRGSASMGFYFDEMAHLVTGESRMSDVELWKAAIPSIQQFREEGMVFANSSPYQKLGKFFELYEQSLKLDPPNTGKPEFPDHFMLRFPSWELFRDWEEAGLPMPPSLPPDESPEMAFEEKRDPVAFKVEHRACFAEVEQAFLSPEMVDRMFDPAYTFETIGRTLTPTTGAIGFLRYKGHSDPASVGANFGLAIGHIEEVVNKETGYKEPHVIFDFIDAFYPEDFKNPMNPDQPGTIDWLQVIPTITHLITNFRPYEWTFDQFESAMPIQTLIENTRKLGIQETMIFEKFATPKLNQRRAYNFRAALNLGRVHAPHPSTFSSMATKNSIELGRNELKFLQEKLGKVDKQNIGAIQTKDIADCLMEVVDALIGDTLGMAYEGLTAPPALGLPMSPSGSLYGNTPSFSELNEWSMNKRWGDGPSVPQRGRGLRRGRRG
jgi:hypothetical protein